MAEETLEPSNALSVDACAHAFEFVGPAVDFVVPNRAQVMLEAIAKSHGSGVVLLDLAHVGVDAIFLYPGRCDHRHLDVQLDLPGSSIAIGAIDLFLNRAVARTPVIGHGPAPERFDAAEAKRAG